MLIELGVEESRKLVFRKYRVNVRTEPRGPPRQSG